MSLRGFATINIWADDVPAAAAWYTQVVGVQPYFERPGPDGRPAYVEFRIGDYQAELGIIDRSYAPAGATNEPGGAIMHWHVDDLRATVARLLSLGATQYDPITPRGDTGFVTASVVDPFGNILGVMNNPHYLDVLAANQPQTQHASQPATESARRCART
jgi:predicted enzyme related to lactoylglutathione lyase